MECTVGFTGTQHGMTEAQLSAVEDLISKLQPTKGVHGDCIGADAEFHQICLSKQVPVVIRPCTIENKRAWCQDALKVYPPKLPLERNGDIVIECSVLIATPKEFKEQLRSGTWATIRRARKLKKPVYIVSPDGTIS